VQKCTRNNFNELSKVGKAEPRYNGAMGCMKNAPLHIDRKTFGISNILHSLAFVGGRSMLVIWVKEITSTLKRRQE